MSVTQTPSDGALRPAHWPAFSEPVSTECLALMQNAPETFAGPMPGSVRFRLATPERCFLALGALGVLLVGITDILDHVR